MSSRKSAKMPITWVGGGSNENERRPNTAQLTSWKKDGSPESWYINRFPIVVAAKEWDVSRSRNALLQRKKQSRIRIEVRRGSDQPLGIHGYRDLEEGSALSDWSQVIRERDVITFNVLKRDSDDTRSSIKRSSSGTSDGTSAASERPSSRGSVSTIGILGVDDKVQNEHDSTSHLDINWMIKSSVPLSKVTFKREGSSCTAKLNNIKDSSKEEYILTFASENIAKSFLKFVGGLKMMYQSVAKTHMKNTLELSSVLGSIQSVDFLIEIISATDLKAVNRHFSDPFVSVHYAGEIIHKTDVVKRNLDPIYTIKTNSMFIFTLHPEDYYHSDIVFQINDFESFSTNKYLGQVELSNEELLTSDGQRIERKLKNLETGTETQGYLAIRCKRATQQDIDFVRDSTKSVEPVRKAQNLYTQPLYEKQGPTLQFKKSKIMNGEKHYFIRPMNPNKDQQWMTKAQVEEISRKPSQNWTEAGSGSLGELFVEVISCDDLPDLDSGLPTNKTDPFATLVFEDAIVTTSVIRDTLNPRFMPWTRRAFKFNIAHSTSPLFVGIFDHDLNSKYDPVGRVSIPLEHFSPNTEYNLSYDLYNSGEIVKRHAKGRIKLRLKLKWNGRRKVFFDSIKEPTQFTVNIADERNLAHAKYTVQGHHDSREYDLKTLLRYASEILQYRFVIFTIIEGLKTVLLWRGHFELKLFGCWNIKLPIHSMVMLSFGIILTEFPQYTVSVFFASIAWFMIACLEYSRRDPSPWSRPPRYFKLLLEFLFGYTTQEQIDPDQRKDAKAEFIQKEKDRLEQNEREAELFLQRLDDDIETLDEMKEKILYKDSLKSSTMSLQLFKNQLQPVQKSLSDIAFTIRLINRVLSWDLKYLSFWITTGSIILSILFIFVWEEAFLWTKRIIFYVLLGPFNKIVDVLYLQKLERMTGAEKRQRENARQRHSNNRYNQNRIKVQIEKEELLKAAAMKEYLFGKHSLAIPSIRQPELFPSVPRNESYAIPIYQDAANDLHKSLRRSAIYGQYVSGTFVPQNVNDHVTPNEYSKLVEQDGNYGST